MNIFIIDFLASYVITFNYMYYMPSTKWHKIVKGVIHVQ